MKNRIYRGCQSLSKFDIALFVIYGILFVYFISIPPIYSQDSNSYWHLDIYRYPGYVVFLRSVEFIFGSFYDVVVLAIHLLFGFFAIHVFFKNLSSLFNLNILFKGILLLILLFPFFPPLYIANNLASEGIAYPLYLFIISFAIDFVFRSQSKRIYFFAVAFVLLALTRGQFMIIVPIVAFIYILKLKKKVFKKPHLFYLILLLTLPFIASTLDSTYRKLVHGYFVTTPYSFVNAITLPLFVSDVEDSILFKDEGHKIIFLNTYRRIDSLNLLSSKVNGTNTEKYMVFHDNFPIICNQTFHVKGVQYYTEKYHKPSKSYVQIEVAAKQMFLILVMDNFSEWASLYFTSILHGFKSIFILIFVSVVLIFSTIKIVRKFTINDGVLFLASCLIISNAMLTAMACHSIMRYLFYNYSLGFIILVILFRKITSKP